MSVCYRHPDRAAAAMCMGCAGFVCPECDVFVDGKHYCTVCAGEQRWASAPRWGDDLHRSKRDHWISGVCGGIAETTGISSRLLRIILFIMTFFTGLLPGLLIYVAFALILPRR